MIYRRLRGPLSFHPFAASRLMSSARVIRASFRGLSPRWMLREVPFAELTRLVAR
jgi:hypothetical protein